MKCFFYFLMKIILFLYKIQNLITVNQTLDIKKIWKWKTITTSQHILSTALTLPLWLVTSTLTVSTSSPASLGCWPGNFPKSTTNTCTFRSGHSATLSRATCQSTYPNAKLHTVERSWTPHRNCAEHLAHWHWISWPKKFLNLNAGQKCEVHILLNWKCSTLFERCENIFWDVATHWMARRTW